MELFRLCFSIRAGLRKQKHTTEGPPAFLSGSSYLAVVLDAVSTCSDDALAPASWTKIVIFIPLWPSPQVITDYFEGPSHRRRHRLFGNCSWLDIRVDLERTQ